MDLQLCCVLKILKARPSDKEVLCVGFVVFFGHAENQPPTLNLQPFELAKSFAEISPTMATGEGFQVHAFALLCPDKW